MSHYIVILDWATENESDIDILGVKHSYEEAKEIFDKHIENEKHLAKNNNWYVYEDMEDLFTAGVYGFWDDGHTRLYIQEVK